VRMHLQDVLITVLEHLDAGPEDRHAVEPLAFGGNKLRPLYVLTASSWSTSRTATVDFPTCSRQSPAAGYCNTP
jgi:hypothetical protein